MSTCELFFINLNENCMESEGWGEWFLSRFTRKGNPRAVSWPGAVFHDFSTKFFIAPAFAYRFKKKAQK